MLHHSLFTQSDYSQIVRSQSAAVENACKSNLAVALAPLWPGKSVQTAADIAVTRPPSFFQVFCLCSTSYTSVNNTYYNATFVSVNSI